MRKLISMIAVMFITLIATAQTVESSKLFENTYITVLGGATTTGQFSNVPKPFFWDGFNGVTNGVRPFVGLELGKNITPVVGVSLEALGFINTTTSYTAFDESALLGNAKLNLSNWFGGYKGYPRRVEVVLVGGLGWGHDYAGEYQTWTSYPKEDYSVVYGRDVNSSKKPATDKNYVVYDAGAELNVNLGKARAWQITVRPGILWFNKTNGIYQSLPTWKHDARFNLQAGVTYKFGSRSKKSHNFVLCPYSVTQSDYDAALARIKELESQEPKVKEVTKEVVKETVVEKIVFASSKPYQTVVFEIGDYSLSNAAKGILDDFAAGVGEDGRVLVTGSADLATGSQELNDGLAENRAKVVAEYLASKGVKNIVTETKFDVSETPEASRVAIVRIAE